MNAGEGFLPGALVWCDCKERIIPAWCTSRAGLPVVMVCTIGLCAGGVQACLPACTVCAHDCTLHRA